MQKKFSFEKMESFSNENGEQTTRFRLRTMEGGQSYGVTLGNTLRRVLLTELQGTAITAIRINGINHEYTVISGVREDILDLLLNFKQIKFRGLLDKPCYINLDVKGPRLITAGDISLVEGLSIINSNQYIAAVSEQSELKIELKIESGKGYRLLTNDSQLRTGDFLGIDAIFTPVKNVSLEVSDSYTLGGKIIEQLELEITTNGSLTHLDVLINSEQIAQDLFSSIIISEPKKVSKMVDFSVSDEFLIEELKLSSRAYKCLQSIGVRTINDLSRCSVQELKSIKNFGQKSMNEVIQKLKDQFNIHLASE